MRSTALACLLAGGALTAAVVASPVGAAIGAAPGLNDRATTTRDVVSPAVAAGDRFAVVNRNGTLARGKGVVSTSRLGAGTYEVIFNRTITQCVFESTLGLAAFVGTESPGETTVVGRVGTTTGVFLQTFDSDGAPSDRGFHLYVGCR